MESILKPHWWPAPAKLNLFLHITGQRSDGYHLLQTVFQFLDYGDALRFTITSEPTIQLLDGLPGVACEQNLIWRAARTLQQHAGVRQGVQIQLKKRLPMGAGLGGGSSNAATTLVALNQLWGASLQTEALQTLGLSLGADVPVFIAGEASWAEGVGEKLQPIVLEEPWYMVVVPDCHVSTAELFAATELTRDCEMLTIAGFLSGEGRNVFEPLVRTRFPQVNAVFEWLARFGTPKMTGTGSCVFVRCATQADAEAIKRQLPKNWQGFVAKACNESPLKTIACATQPNTGIVVS